MGRGNGLATLNKEFTRKISGFGRIFNSRNKWQMLTTEAISHMPAVFLEICYIPEINTVL